ncbi:hypothetical protein HTZ84_09830 [Haloterrigena sp. SYSU A558-1]|uniref:Uncharacterized protein n=1 Tax=Haloterrigena gelatinilytica TaxID=2741724 RepID=A0ABX2LB42_9EURY|nr:hypothetical protein [Haloterrigena gelatinilytica]NUC72605.1 hypothetical protein [Haloterrigena gelatinilytica]
MPEKIITKSAEILTNQYGLQQISSLKDAHGVHATVFVDPSTGQRYVVVSKEYAYKGLASFMWKVVKGAARAEYPLVFFNNDGETFTAFDPHVVKEFSVVSEGPSKLAHEEWRNIGLDYGISLRRYMTGETPTLPGGQTALGSFN